MRRLTVGACIFATAAIAAAVALVVSGARLPAAPVAASDSALGSLRLDTGSTVTPVGRDVLTAGSDYTYQFTVTNTGRRPVERLGVRSEKVIGGRAGSRLEVRSVSNPACSGTARVDCMFHRLEPGEKQTVKVQARSAATRRPGDQLVINTFLGTFAPTPSGGVAFDVIGERDATTATFAKPNGTEI